MGKLKGIIQFTGSFDGLSFYESGGKIIVRKRVVLMARKSKRNRNMRGFGRTVLSLAMWQRFVKISVKV
ncbi:hypothetical protein H9X57_18140 [Flavobacterium piscinae]|uniref:hypothetical protein n=1 Tax=Flavobacterium piscinae TaxID=2506424 RepID=UPI0019B0CF44|nr:hypothetical protein [Flavobacterium piscinae]MBC8884600.1 hypothetical protein [Flavobacterium piscinae]